MTASDLSPQDVRIDTGRGLDGAFVRVTHLPTGLSFTGTTQRRSTIAAVTTGLLERLRQAVAARTG